MFVVCFGARDKQFPGATGCPERLPTRKPAAACEQRTRTAVLSCADSLVFPSRELQSQEPALPTLLQSRRLRLVPRFFAVFSGNALPLLDTTEDENPLGWRQSSFVPISSMVHIGTNRAIFGVIDPRFSAHQRQIRRGLKRL